MIPFFGLDLEYSKLLQLLINKYESNHSKNQYCFRTWVPSVLSFPIIAYSLSDKKHNSTLKERIKKREKNSLGIQTSIPTFCIFGIGCRRHSFVFRHENFSIIILGCVFLPSIKEKPQPGNGVEVLVRWWVHKTPNKWVRSLLAPGN